LTSNRRYVTGFYGDTPYPNSSLVSQFRHWFLRADPDSAPYPICATGFSVSSLVSTGRPRQCPVPHMCNWFLSFVTGFYGDTPYPRNHHSIIFSSARGGSEAERRVPRHSPVPDGRRLRRRRLREGGQLKHVKLVVKLSAFKNCAPPKPARTESVDGQKNDNRDQRKMKTIELHYTISQYF